MQTRRRVWNVAHRGASADRPENTHAAFELAIAQGADVVECDVRRAADGSLLILHDPDVGRTTDGAGPLREMTSAAARALDAGGGERIPRLAEVLELARGRARVNVDIREPDTTVAVVRAVSDADMLGSVTFISFLPEVWEELDTVAPESPRVQVVASAAALAGLAMVDAAGRAMSGIGVPHALVTADLVEVLDRRGMPVFAWTVDEPAEMRRLVGCGVSGIVTNRPRLLGEVLGAAMVAGP